MSWTPAIAVGPSLLVTRDFVAGGFDISAGAHNFQDYDPNRLTDSTAAAVASLGLLALPKGALLGNELGVDFISRIYFLSGDRSVMETVLRPVSRVLRADSRVSFPSVLGTIVPAVGIATLFEKEGVTPQITSFHGDYLAFLTRWSFDARLIVLPKPVLLFVAAEPFVELFVPYSGAAPHCAFGANVNFGLSIVEK